MEHDQENKLLQSESPVYRGEKIDQAQHVMQELWALGEKM